jgi:Glycine cleavage system P-protein
MLCRRRPSSQQERWTGCAWTPRVLIDETVPKDIRLGKALDFDRPLSERGALDRLRETANKNRVLTSLIGQGYHGTIMPPAIQRNILENPAWYTAYTPYQPEVSQGRLEALLNFQTVVSDLTGLDIANASPLDEATAAAEAMALARRVTKSQAAAYFVDENCLGGRHHNGRCVFRRALPSLFAPIRQYFHRVRKELAGKPGNFVYTLSRRTVARRTGRNVAFG